jgi:hypothetical protein
VRQQSGMLLSHATRIVTELTRSIHVTARIAHVLEINALSAIFSQFLTLCAERISIARAVILS